MGSLAYKSDGSFNTAPVGQESSCDVCSQLLGQSSAQRRKFTFKRKMANKNLEAKHEKILKALLRLPENKRCAVCDTLVRLAKSIFNLAIVRR